MYSNYQEMRLAIQNLAPFKGNSVQGIWEGSMYLVYSYSTVILEVDDKTGEYRFNSKKYSRTTSRLQSIIRQDMELKKIKPKEMLTLEKTPLGWQTSLRA